ncbi:lysosomal acid phosphatase-like protein 3 [Leptotrombidium deliense]|uniref:acid phosphatase n=1 Tax=Leptotrombidium deliense TaxID=299467 RepID=A0A443SRK1_9ACAR|nr:lysosomal acid phosphatase-like protein 3 [Leptotrombidium deliense]
MYYTKLFCFFLLLFFSVDCDNSTLKSIIIVHRHGDRTPIHLYPNDPYRNESYWPDGMGQLSIAGKVRMFKLGKYLRRRYFDLLTGNPREVNVKSAESDRCLQSAHLVAAGAYPPEGRWIWDSHISWQPFAVNTKPEKYDGMLSVDAECPTAAKEKKEVMKSVEFRKYSEMYKKLFQFLSEKTGDHLTNVFNTEYLHSTFWNQSQLSPFILATILRVYKDFELHDTSVAALLNALGVYNFHPPPFGATVLFELHSTTVNSSNVHVIKSFYLNVTESENPIPLQLPACNREDSCSFKMFAENIQELIPNNWRKECGFELKNQTIHRNGDRTPMHTYPNDSFNVHKFWFEGAGQLTERGKERMYRLGQFIQRRYKNFITDKPIEVFARSSAVDRCLQSAQLVLSGMYPPESKWIWNENLNWQPISVKSSELETDSVSKNLNVNYTLISIDLDAEPKY